MDEKSAEVERAKLAVTIAVEHLLKMEDADYYDIEDAVREGIYNVTGDRLYCDIHG